MTIETTMARPMTDIEQAFVTHTSNEYPPKFVFCATPQGEIRTIRLSEIPTLGERFSLTGMTGNSKGHAHLAAAGNLPILALTDNPVGFY